MSTQIAYDPGNFYIWRASDGFAIHLSLNLVTQLTAQISRAENDQPGGTRGILLGRTVEKPFRTTLIEDFRLLPAGPEGDEDPESDDALFQMARRMTEAGNEQRAVGFFRAQTDGRLKLGQRDLQTLSSLFCEPGNVALVIQTSKRGNDSDAALYYWQDGRPHPHDFGFGFPLDAAQLASGHPGWRYPDPLERMPMAGAPKAPTAPPPAKPKVSEWTAIAPAAVASGEGIRWLRLLPTAALVAIGIAALQMATSSNRTASAATEPTAASASETAAAKAASSATAAGLGLNITSREHQLEIRWNRESAAVMTSDGGTMKITDDG
ncbi:MAG TPA: hypothetical protein VK708_13950, partial [Bryobacteraceae bacterium]|nr:hypothetical protein [Bryobacteraceae bacterium]